MHERELALAEDLVCRLLENQNAYPALIQPVGIPDPEILPITSESRDADQFQRLRTKIPLKGNRNLTPEAVLICARISCPKQPAETLSKALLNKVDNRRVVERALVRDEFYRAGFEVLESVATGSDQAGPPLRHKHVLLGRASAHSRK